jgi:P-type conjugative transfer protein TrbJ
MFKRLHPGYGSEFSSKNEYQSWSDNTHSAVRNALAVSGAQSESFSSEQDVVRELQLRSQSADGQMKALQAGNDIGVAMVGQMQQLRQLQIAQMSAQNQFMSKDTSVADEKKKSLGIVFGNLRSSKVTQGAKTVPIDPNP